MKLRSPIPVYLGYWTARASADGMLQFRRDVYGIDRRQTSLLADRLSRLPQDCSRRGERGQPRRNSRSRYRAGQY